MEDQPPRMIPRIPTADMAEITSRPTFTSATKMFLANGSTAKAVSAVMVETHGANQKMALSDVGRDDVFLEQQLERVGDGLQQPVRPHAHGSQAHLEIGQHLALHQREVAGHQRDGRDEHQRHQHRREQRI